MNTNIVFKDKKTVINSLIQSALLAVDSKNAVKNHVCLNGELLTVGLQTYNLKHFKNIKVVGAGKAAAKMAQALFEILGAKIVNGVVIVKRNHQVLQNFVGPIKMIQAGHPTPDDESIYGAQQIVKIVRNAKSDDLLIVLIAGGGSSLFTLPADKLCLEDIISTTNSLIKCGASILEINTIRKHLSAVKGGYLARMAAPAKTISLILSDVVADSLDAIASGPTVADSTSFADAIDIIKKYKISDRLPLRVMTRLLSGKNGKISETPKNNDPCFSLVQNIIIASGKLAATAALKTASEQNFNTLLVSHTMEGEASKVGQFAASLALDVKNNRHPVSAPACLVFAGETTVVVNGNGQGGRNQELALAAAIAIENESDICIATFATDGQDGPTDAAGAIVTGETIGKAKQMKLNARDFLVRNDSYTFFNNLNDLIKTGPTLTNVADLTFILIF